MFAYMDCYSDACLVLGLTKGGHEMKCSAFPGQGVWSVEILQRFYTFWLIGNVHTYAGFLTRMGNKATLLTLDLSLQNKRKTAELFSLANFYPLSSSSLGFFFSLNCLPPNYRPLIATEEK